MDLSISLGLMTSSFSIEGLKVGAQAIASKVALDASSFMTSALTVEGLKVGASKALPVITSYAGKFFRGYMLYSMYEAALSDLLCLQTLRHGSSPYGVLNITLRGPDLDRAGIGGEAAYYNAVGQNSAYAARDRARRAFYVVKDHNDDLNNYCASRATAKYYALRSTAKFWGSLLPLPKSWKAAIIKGTVECIEGDPRVRIFGLICPSVKFHIDPRKIASGNILLYDDPSGGFGAMWTQHQFSILDIGIIGVLKNGINCNLFSRILENKGQFLIGVAELVVAVAFTAFFFPQAIPGGMTLVSTVSSIFYSLIQHGEQGLILFCLIFSAPIAFAAVQL